MSIDKGNGDRILGLGQSDEPMSIKALEKLSNLKREQIDALSQAWNSIETDRRRAIVEQLVSLAEDNVELNYDAIYRLALEDADGVIRARAIEGLWESYEPETANRMIQLLTTDPDPSVRAAAASSLSRFTLNAELDKLTGDLPHRLEVVLRDVISMESETVEVRRRAVEAIAYLSQPGIADIIEAAYQDEDLAMRASALHAMGRNCDSRWLETILTELESEQPELRYEAARASGELENEQAVPYLQNMLDDDDREVRLAAIAALGEIGGKEARDAIAKRLESDDPEMAEAAEEAMAELEFGKDPLGF